MAILMKFPQPMLVSFSVSAANSHGCNALDNERRCGTLPRTPPLLLSMAIGRKDSKATSACFLLD